MGLEQIIKTVKEKITREHTLGVVIKDLWQFREDGNYHVWVAEYSSELGFSVDKIKHFGLNVNMSRTNPFDKKLPTYTIVKEMPFGMGLEKPTKEGLNKERINSDQILTTFKDWVENNKAEIQIKTTI